MTAVQLIGKWITGCEIEFGARPKEVRVPLSGYLALLRELDEFRRFGTRISTENELRAFGCRIIPEKETDLALMADKTPRISLSEWHESLKKPVKRNKYNAKKTEIGGEAFPSALEAGMYSQLLFMQRLGVKSEVKRYHTVHLTLANVSWKVDASAVDEFGQFELHEAKGVSTTDYLIKLKLYRVYGEFPLHIWKDSGSRPVIADTIIPRGVK